MRPLCIDLYCGLGGWAEGFMSEGWRVIGFDIERHDYGTGGYPGELVLQDVRTIHGAQFRDADMIVASPPCQEFSYRAMPWKRAKALPPPVDGINLFWQCWRIQHEASQAKGEHVPMVVENVCGAQRWIGRARWHYGSYYLWGYIPALMPVARSIKNGEIGGGSWFANGRQGQDACADGLKFGGGWWHDSTNNLIRKASSRSTARKAASAQIAKIPFPLAQHIARCYAPLEATR